MTTPRKPSPAPFLRWVLTKAQTAKPLEWVTLSSLAGHADPDGAATWPSPKTIASNSGAGEDGKSVKDAMARLRDRGLIREMPEDQRPQAWHKQPRGQRPRCWEIVVPASVWSPEELEALNAWRASLDPPRPPIVEDVKHAPPTRTRRADAGVSRKPGGSTKPPSDPTPDETEGGSNSTPQGGLIAPPRGVYETPNLVHDSGPYLAPPTPHADTVPDPVPSDPNDGGGRIDSPGDDTGADAPAVPRGQAAPTVPAPVPSDPNDAPTTQDQGRERMERADAILARAVQTWGRSVRRPLTAPERRVLLERVTRQLERGGDPETIHAVLTDIAGLRDPIRGLLSKTNDSVEDRELWGVRADDRPDTVLRPARPHCGDAECRRGYRGVDSEGRPIPCRVQVTDPLTGETHTCHPKATAVPAEDIPRAGLSEKASSQLSAVRAQLAQTAKAADEESRTRRRKVRRAPASTW